MSEWKTGVAISLCSSTILTCGQNLIRYSAVREKRRLPIIHRKYYRRPLWLLGFLIFVLGNVGDFVALGYAAASLLVPLGSISLVTNTLIGGFLLREPLSWLIVVSTLIIAAGATVSVLNSNHDDTSFTVDDLVVLLQRPQFLLLVVLYGALLAILLPYSTRSYRRITSSRALALHEEPATPQSSTTSEFEDGQIVLKPADQASQPCRLVPSPSLVAAEPDHYRFHPVSLSTPAPVFAVTRQRRLVTAAAFCAASGILAAVTTLSSKALSELFRSAQSNTPEESHPVFIALFALVLVSAAVGQVHMLSCSLEVAGSLVVVPFHFSCWVLFSLTASNIFYMEFETLTSAQTHLFLAGVIITVSGAALLAFAQQRVHAAADKPQKVVD
jgi:uncharacterized membrane protein